MHGGTVIAGESRHLQRTSERSIRSAFRIVAAKVARRVTGIRSRSDHLRTLIDAFRVDEINECRMIEMSGARLFRVVDTAELTYRAVTCESRVLYAPNYEYPTGHASLAIIDILLRGHTCIRDTRAGNCGAPAVKPEARTFANRCRSLTESRETP